MTKTLYLLNTVEIVEKLLIARLNSTFNLVCGACGENKTRHFTFVLKGFTPVKWAAVTDKRWFSPVPGGLTRGGLNRDLGRCSATLLPGSRSKYRSSGSEVILQWLADDGGYLSWSCWEGMSPARASLLPRRRACHQVSSSVLTTWRMSPLLKATAASLHGTAGSSSGS